MTWDATVYACAHPPTDFPRDFEPIPMGAVKDVKARINRHWPNIVWVGPRGTYVGQDCQAELSLWKEMELAEAGDVERIAVTALGNGHLVEALAALCVPNGWVAMDDGAGELLDFSTAVTPVERDRVVAGAVDGKAGAARRRLFRLYALDGAPTPSADGLFRRYPLGDAADVRRLVEEVLPLTQWTADAGLVVEPSYRLEFRMPARGPIDVGEVYAIGAGVDAVLRRLCAQHGWSAWEEGVGWMG